jgi:hypothetical protein
VKGAELRGALPVEVKHEQRRSYYGGASGSHIQPPHIAPSGLLDVDTASDSLETRTGACIVGRFVPSRPVGGLQGQARGMLIAAGSRGPFCVIGAAFGRPFPLNELSTGGPPNIRTMLISGNGILIVVDATTSCAHPAASPAVTLGRWRLRDATALPLAQRNGSCAMPPISIAEKSCDRLAETASSPDTRETMQYLALRWRILPSEAGGKIEPVTRQPIGPPLYFSE